MFLLAQPGGSGDFATDWIVLIGFGVVFVVGLLYLLIARPTGKSTAAEGDAIAVAEKLRAGRENHHREQLIWSPSRWPIPNETKSAAAVQLPASSS